MLVNPKNIKTMNIVEKVFETSQQVEPRTLYEVLAYLMQEAGELATEISIGEGFLNRPQGKDGIIGEAVDVILCALDIAWLNGATPEDIQSIVVKKLEKWKNNKYDNRRDEKKIPV